MIGDGKARSATRLMQAMLQKYDPTLKVDGWPGSYTQRVYSRAPADLQIEIVKQLSKVGVTPHDLFSWWSLRQNTKAGQRIKATARASRQLSVSSDIYNIIMDAADRANVPRDYMLTMASIESQFNPNATSISRKTKRPTAGGLFQFVPGQGGWITARERAARDGVQLGQVRQITLSKLPDSDKRNLYDPKQNALAAAYFTRANIDALKRAGIKPGSNGQYPNWMLYLAHQQGAGGAINLLKGRSSGYEAMAANLPDKQRWKATNPDAFVQHWKDAYAQHAASEIIVA